MNTPDLNQITDLTTQQRAGGQKLLQDQQIQSTDFLNRYKGTLSNQETSGALATRIGSELGLPALQSNANSLNQTLLNLPQTYSKATTGYDVNANQLARAVGTKQAELSPYAQAATNAAQNAQSQLTTRMGYAQQDQAKELMPYEKEQSMLNDRMARETTMYTQNNQSELDGLIAKINSGIQISEGEKNRAQQLANQEAQYHQQMSLAQESNKNTGTQVISQGGVQRLIDSRTGKVIAQYGSGTAKPASAYLGGSSGQMMSIPSSPNFKTLK